VLDLYFDLRNKSNHIDRFYMIQYNFLSFGSGLLFGATLYFCPVSS